MSNFTAATLAILIVLLLLLPTASIVIWTIKNGISPMPSSAKAKAIILQIISQRSGKIYELGSGWGTLALPLAQQNREAQVIGLESSPIPYACSRLRSLFCRPPNLQFKRKDFFSVSLSDADLIVCYLYPGAMQRLRSKFSQELKPGTLIISNTFAIPGWQPEREIEVQDLYKSKIYVYIKTKGQ